MLAALVPTVLMTASASSCWPSAGSKSMRGGRAAPRAGVLRDALTGYILGTDLRQPGRDAWPRVQNDFLSSVSHELRTPLTSIRHVHRVRCATAGVTDSAETQRCLAVIDREIGRLEAWSAS